MEIHFQTVLNMPYAGAHLEIPIVHFRCVINHYCISFFFDNFFINTHCCSFTFHKQCLFHFRKLFVKFQKCVFSTNKDSLFGLI